MSKKTVDSVNVLDKSSRRRFMRNGSGLLLAGATASLSPAALAADCDQGGEQSASSDQDSGEGADPKDCQPKNIISKNLPERKQPPRVKTIKT